MFCPNVEFPNKPPPDEALPNAGVAPNTPVDWVVVVEPNSPPYTRMVSFSTFYVLRYYKYKRRVVDRKDKLARN